RTLCARPYRGATAQRRRWGCSATAALRRWRARRLRPGRGAGAAVAVLLPDLGDRRSGPDHGCASEPPLPGHDVRPLDIRLGRATAGCTHVVPGWWAR